MNNLLLDLKIHINNIIDCSTFNRAFFRISNTESYLFISDMPRFTNEDKLDIAIQAISNLGTDVTLKNDLLYINPNKLFYLNLINKYNKDGIIAFPSDYELIPLYNLYRILNIHKNNILDFSNKYYILFIKNLFGKYNFKNIINLATKDFSVLIRKKEPLPYYLTYIINEFFEI